MILNEVERGRTTMKRAAIVLILVAMVMCNIAFVTAASDPAVTIISPAQSISGSNLLVSVKLTAPKKIKVYVYEEKEKIGNNLVSINPATVAAENFSSKKLYSVTVMTPDTYESTGSLQFYNKQISDVSPGLYRIKVDVLNKSDAVTASSVLRTLVMPKNTELVNGNDIFQSQQTGALKWIQNLLKSIFKN